MRASLLGSFWEMFPYSKERQSSSFPLGCVIAWNCLAILLIAWGWTLKMVERGRKHELLMSPLNPGQCSPRVCTIHRLSILRNNKFSYCLSQFALGFCYSQPKGSSIFAELPACVGEPDVETDNHVLACWHYPEGEPEGWRRCLTRLKVGKTSLRGVRSPERSTRVCWAKGVPGERVME